LITKDYEKDIEVARLFSEGKFDQTADWLADEVEFHIYEDKKHLIGKAEVLEFCEGSFIDLIIQIFRVHNS
jgi:hypothetical protein